jgi:streptogramin lyase
MSTRREQALAAAATRDGKVGANKIGRVTTAGVFAEFPIPTGGSGAWWITPGPDGALWFDEFYTNKIGRISIMGVITEFPVPERELLDHYSQLAYRFVEVWNGDNISEAHHRHGQFQRAQPCAE